MNAPTNARALAAALLRRLRGSAAPNAQPAVPWYWRLMSAFAGAALFAATALWLAQERVSRTWSEAPHAGDGAALLSQAGVLVEEGRTFALVVVMTLVLLVAVLASASFRQRGRLHLCLATFALCGLCAVAANVAIHAARALG